LFTREGLSPEYINATCSFMQKGRLKFRSLGRNTPKN